MSSFNEYSDNELVSLLKSDNHGAFTEIYNRYSESLYLHGYKKLRDREQARDIVQDIFTVLWNRRTEFELHALLSAYLFTAVRNRVIKVIAHKNVESNYFSLLGSYLEEGQAATDHFVRIKDLEAHIENEIDALPEKMQAVFRRSRQSNLSHKEIAQELNLSESTVKKQVNNALKILRVKLKSFQLIFPIIF
jgi:RNA polymerase sigma-70 factor (ECF subfamily)